MKPIVTHNVYLHLMSEGRRLNREGRTCQVCEHNSVGGDKLDYKFQFRNEGNSVALGLFLDLVNSTLPMGKDRSGRMMKLPGSVLLLAQRPALFPGDSVQLSVNFSYVQRTPYLLRVIYTNVHEQEFEVRQAFAREGEGIPGRPLDVEFFIDGRRIVGKPASLEPFKPPEVDVDPGTGAGLSGLPALLSCCFAVILV